MTSIKASDRRVGATYWNKQLLGPEEVGYPPEFPCKKFGPGVSFYALGKKTKPPRHRHVYFWHFGKFGLPMRISGAEFFKFSINNFYFTN